MLEAWLAAGMIKHENKLYFQSFKLFIILHLLAVLGCLLASTSRAVDCDYS